MNAKAISEPPEGPKGVRGCLFLFGMVFAAFGLGFIWFGFISPRLQAQAAKTWETMPCTIISSEIDSHPGEDKTTYSAEIEFEYEVDGKTYRSDRDSFVTINGTRAAAKKITKKYPVGAQVEGYYDPSDPSRAVLDRETLDSIFAGLIFPMIFVLVGFGIAGVALFVVGRKKEPPADAISAGTAPTDVRRYSAPNEQGALIAHDHSADLEDEAWSIPKKLQPEYSRWVVLLVITGLAVFWNGIVGVFVSGLIFDSPGIMWQVGLGIFLIPFVVIGLGLIVAVFFLFLTLFNPIVEVALSAGAVALGDSVDIAWETVGNHRRIRRLIVEIQGEQTASYRRGTDTLTDHEIFELLPVCDVTDVAEIQFGSRTVQIPANTMHTFEGGKNQVSWTIVVKGEIRRWPDIQGNYPFRIKP